MGILFSIDHVSFSYQTPGGEKISALHDLSLEIEEGEFIAIIGANGSGKTTLARLMATLLTPTSGNMLVAGINTREKNAWNELHQMVGMVFQNPEDQVITTIVEEDVAFGLENMGLPPAEIRLRVREALEEVNLWDERKRPPNLLSAGQLQRLALAGVIAMQPRCVIFDEATTMLDPVGRKVALDAMKRLNVLGVTVIFITHFMEEAVEAERIIVLNHGRLFMDGNPRNVFSDPGKVAEANLDLPFAGAVANELCSSLLGFSKGILTIDGLINETIEIWKRKNRPITHPVVENTDLSKCFADSQYLVQVENLGHIYLRGTPLEKMALDQVSLHVGEGQSHGLAGVTGSGKSTLLQHLNGLLRPQSGTVRVGPYDLNDLNIHIKTIIQIAGLAFQNPEMQFFEQYVGDEIAYGPRQLDIPEKLADRVCWAMEMVGLDFLAFKDRLIFNLSGGERRKVALASTLALKPSLLLLDEPTAGLDPFTRKELMLKFRDMQAAGVTMILSSHQMDTISELSRNLTIMSNGKDVVSGLTAEIFGQPELLAKYGLEPPELFKISNELRRNGLPLSEKILDGKTLVMEIAGILG